MKKKAFIFPGQGAQYIGMGQDFYHTYKESKMVFEKASSILGIDMEELIFKNKEKLNITEFTQIAMVTTCMAMVTAVTKLGIKPDVCAGLSLGEYPAMMTGGVMSFEEGISVVRKRGIYMDTALPAGESTMAAVIGLSGEEIKKICEQTEGIVTVANYNCPGQTVISGETSAVSTASKRLKEVGARRVIPLKVSGAFHSPMLKDAGEKLGVELDKITIKDPVIPYVANVNAEYIYSKNDIKNLLSKQVYSSVKWQQSVENMINSGVNLFIEIGPGKTLSSFVKKIDPTCKVLNVEKVEDLEALKEETYA